MSENKPKIYKSNALVEAKFHMSVMEYRILIACIAQGKAGSPITDDRYYIVPVKDLIKLSKTKAKTIYQDVKAAAIRLKDQPVTIIDYPNGEGKRPEVMYTGWVQTVVYSDERKEVKVRFNHDMLPYLSNLSRQYTKYPIHYVGEMNSMIAVRIFEMLMQWKHKAPSRTFEIDWLRDRLMLEDNYELFADFRRFVIDRAVKQINQHTPMQVKATPMKTGRRFTHVRFDFAFPTDDKVVATQAQEQEQTEDKAKAKKPAKANQAQQSLQLQIDPADPDWFTPDFIRMQAIGWKLEHDLPAAEAKAREVYKVPKKI